MGKNASFHAIALDCIDRASRVESFLLGRIPGLKAETTFRAFPPAALLSSDPKRNARTNPLYFMLVLLPTNMLSLAWIFNLAPYIGSAPKDFIPPPVDNTPSLILRFTLWLMCNWLSLASANSVGLQYVRIGEESDCPDKSLRTEGRLRGWLLLKICFGFNSLRHL
ncbi:hypothetical protein PG999_010542 [Apiospora kogelbergensis]|uniref:Uncharacterized protein n=1 Tax=Apiospora kogelbergensis TaxID=1337665 RepID=A0AAW0QRS8_9PEZI